VFMFYVKLEGVKVAILAGALLVVKLVLEHSFSCVRGS
jgi:hypothetical protein